MPSTKCLATHSKMATITTAIGCLIAIWSSFFVLSPRPLQSPCHINSGDELVGSHGPRVSLSSVLAHLWGCSKSCSTIPSSPSGESGVGRSVFLKNSFYRIYDYRRKVPGTVHACVCVCVLSRFSHIWLFVIPWTVAHQAPLSMGFSRQEYWSGLPYPPPGDLPNPGIEPASLMSPTLADRFFTIRATWEAPPGTE